MKARDVLKKVGLEPSEEYEVRWGYSSIIIEGEDYWQDYTYEFLARRLAGSITLSDDVSDREVKVNVQQKHGCIDLVADGYHNFSMDPDYDHPVVALEVHEGELAVLYWDDFHCAEPERVVLEGSRVAASTYWDHPTKGIEDGDAPYDISLKDPCSACKEYYSGERLDELVATNIDVFGSTWVHMNCAKEMING